MSWSRTTKSLLFAGFIAIVASFSGVMTSFGQGGIRTMTHDYYPGPCNTSPKSVTITFEGRTSGCTQSGGTCVAGEEIVFTAAESAPDYSFQVCDRFIWTFGDGRVIETFGPNVSYRFPFPGARSAMLTVRNSFGETTSNAVTVPNPTAVTCGSGQDRLCLRANRFRVTLFARDPRTGRTGSGQALPEGDQFGYFSIPALTGDASNIEVFVKVIGPVGPPFGQNNYWVFFGGLTDLEYTLTVFDTQTGLTETYLKESGQIRAGLDTESFVGGGFAALPPTCAEAAVAVRQPNQTPGACVTNANTLCLANGVIKVTLAARDLDNNRTGPGVATRENQSFGYFAIPALTNDPSNPEVFIKVLDVRALPPNGFWIFFSGLTHFEYDILVTNTQTGTTFKYTKAYQSRCGGTDTAFPPN